MRIIAWSWICSYSKTDHNLRFCIFLFRSFAFIQSSCDATNNQSAGNQQYPNDLTNVSTIRSLSAQSIDDDVLPDDLSDFQSSHLIRSTNQSNLLAATKRPYYYTKDGATGKRLNHPGVMDLDTETDTDLTREMIDYQRSLSEGRLLDK